MSAAENNNRIEITRANRANFLLAAYELSNWQCKQIILIDDVGKKIGIDNLQEILELAVYLDQKGLFHLDGGGFTGHLTISGLDLIEEVLAPTAQNIVPKSGSTSQPVKLTVNAPVSGGIQINNSECTQVASITSFPPKQSA